MPKLLIGARRRYRPSHGRLDAPCWGHVRTLQAAPGPAAAALHVDPRSIRWPAAHPPAPHAGQPRQGPNDRDQEEGAPLGGSSLVPSHAG